MVESSTENLDVEVLQNGCVFLGEGVTFKGSLSVPEKIVVHGTVEGDVESRELIVGPKGTVKGNVRVDQADVHGKIMESAVIKMCLVVRKTGRVEGAVSYREIEIERGGIVTGELSVGAADKPQAEAQLEDPQRKLKVVSLDSL